MKDDIITGASPKGTEMLIEAWTGFTDASDILDGLSPEQAVTKREGWPYSVAEQVAHMLFYQERSLRTIETGLEADVPTAADGWPAVTEDDWPRLKDDFLAILEKNRELARNPDILDKPYPANSRVTIGFYLLHMVTHDCYHLGQIALLRRLMGAWPPPNGGNTW